MTTESSHAPTHERADAALPHTSAAEVIRAEEQLRIATVTRVRERVSVRKRVVTEDVVRTVTVAREVLEVERVPADSADVATPSMPDSLPEPTDFEIVLHEERVVVTTEIVPVERVRVRVHRLTEQVEVTEVLRREQIAIAPTTPTTTP